MKPLRDNPLASSISSPAAYPPWVRPAVQSGFLLYSMLIGWQFHRFVLWLSDPARPAPERPASVEAWLPISSLMSLTHLVRSGEATPVRPAGLVIFSLILVLSLVAGRGFCGWVCPIGTLSEWSHRLGRKLFGRNLKPPTWLDVALRTLKYAVLGFFVYAIVAMSNNALRAFLESPYNRIADVKMYLFLAEVSRTTAVVLTVLFALSLLVKNFWCRYLCPYGALLGFVAWASPVAVRRNAERCTGCRACEQACPNRVSVCKRERVRSLECTTCFQCVQACPAPGALAVSWPSPRRTLSLPSYAAILLAAFLLVSQAAKSIGYWPSSTSPRLYAALYASARDIGHPRSPRTLSNYDSRIPSIDSAVRGTVSSTNSRNETTESETLQCPRF